MIQPVSWNTTFQPRDAKWFARMNRPLSEKKFAVIRHSSRRGAPFGTKEWASQTAEKLGLESSLRPQDRPRKQEKYDVPFTSGATSQENGTGLSPRSDQACACPGFPSWNMDEAGHWGAGFSCFRRGENQSLISQHSAHDRSFLQSPPDLFPALVF